MTTYPDLGMRKLADLTEMATKIQTENPSLRYGQALFISLTGIDTALSHKLSGGPFDPFYDDGRIEGFLETVGKEWEE